MGKEEKYIPRYDAFVSSAANESQWLYTHSLCKLISIKGEKGMSHSFTWQSLSLTFYFSFAFKRTQTNKKKICVRSRCLSVKHSIEVQMKRNEKKRAEQGWNKRTEGKRTTQLMKITTIAKRKWKKIYLLWQKRICKNVFFSWVTVSWKEKNLFTVISRLSRRGKTNDY